jgi:hypothetical protein
MFPQVRKKMMPRFSAAKWGWLGCFIVPCCGLFSSDALAQDASTTLQEQIVRYGAWPIAIVIIFGLFLLVAPEQVRGLISRLNALTFKGLDAKFDKVADDAFTVAARLIESRSNDDPYEFTQNDRDASKALGTLTTRRNRPKVEAIVRGLADDYALDRGRFGPGAERNKRLSITIAKMRIMAFAARHMATQLATADRAADRVALIAFMQVDATSHIDLFSWLAERIYKEEPFVQYQAALALLSACRNAEPKRASNFIPIVKGVSIEFKKLSQPDQMSHPELLSWCLDSLQGNLAFVPVSPGTQARSPAML